MRIKQEDLNKIAKNHLNELKIIKVLSSEATRVLGSSVDEPFFSLKEAAETISDRISYLKLTGKNVDNLQFKPSVMIKLSSSNCNEARILAAKTLPSKLLGNLTLDKEPAVRHEACKRSSISSVKESILHFPNDEILEEILEQRLIESDENHLHIHDKKKLGPSGKSIQDVELSEAWYKTKALQMIQDHDTLETSWIIPAVRRYCSSQNSFSKINIDEEKLRDAILEELEIREDKELERHKLTESFVKHNSFVKKLVDVKLPIIEETTDAVKILLRKNLKGKSYIEEASKVFEIKWSQSTNRFVNECKSYGFVSPKFIPSRANLPLRSSPSYDDEVALNMFCETWQYLQPHSSKVILEWFVDDESSNQIRFRVKFK